MKKLLKRFKLSEWLIISQIVLSIGTLLLTTVLGNEIIDVIALIGNVINGVILIVVFFSENSKNIKSHELMGQFIFNKVGDNFSEFMDFLMSDQYDNVSLDERNVLYYKLIEMAKSDDYETKRKLSRALPYIFDFDKNMAMDIIEVLRKDIYNDRTDIRRRTLEATLSIIQRQPTLKKQKKYAQKFFSLYSYHKYDDSYTIVASIECYFFIHEFLFKDKLPTKCPAALEELKADVVNAFNVKIGVIEECLVGDIDNVWAVLTALAGLQDIKNQGFAENKSVIDTTLASGKKFSKLTVIKNLYYTCEGFPECQQGCKCDSTGSKYMMDKINRFLSEATDNNVFLVMPTVRYFDCVCSNVCKNEAKKTARSIIKGYFSSDELLISQTAFDKFSKLVKEDSAFARETIAALIAKETEHSSALSREIITKMEALSDEERALFATEPSRIKLKNLADRDSLPPETSDGAKEVFALIDEYNSRVRFIGKIKKYKDEKQL